MSTLPGQFRLQRAVGAVVLSHWPAVSIVERRHSRGRFYVFRLASAANSPEMNADDEWWYHYHLKGRDWPARRFRILIWLAVGFFWLMVLVVLAAAWHRGEFVPVIRAM